MSSYIYYRKNDPKKEPYGKFEAVNLEDAILIAAHVKDMSIKDFLNIFKVEEWKKNSKI